MARYDRIAPLSSPERDQAFPGWPVLRDIEGQDRDADACRRARLRFLALRPARRIAGRDPATVSSGSYLRQIEQAREELGSLPARDVDRVRVSRFLREIEDRDPRRLLDALLEFATQAFSAGHEHAAHEYAMTAESIEPGSAATVLAQFAAGEDVDADPAAALESQWNLLHATEDVARRAAILETLGHALLSMRMVSAADRCLDMVAQRQADLSVRSRARAAHVLCAAQAGDVTTARQRRNALLQDEAEWAPDPRIAASVHNDLAESCVLIGDRDDAREHLRIAIGHARRHGYTRMLERAERILTALEHDTEMLLRPELASSETAQRIAAQIELLELPAPAY